MLPDDRFKLLDGEEIVRTVALKIGDIIQNKTRALQVIAILQLENCLMCLQCVDAVGCVKGEHPARKNSIRHALLSKRGNRISQAQLENGC